MARLDVGVDAGSGQIVAASLTAKEVDDGAEVGPLLDQVAASVASFTGNGGYDQNRVYAGVAEHSPEVDIAVHALNRMSELGRPSYVRIA